MAVNEYSTLSQAYFVVSDGSNSEVYSIPGGAVVSIDTGRGGPDPSLIYNGTNVDNAKASESLP